MNNEKQIKQYTKAYDRLAKMFTNAKNEKVRTGLAKRAEIIIEHLLSR
jgi:hypothetical protein